MELDLLSLGKHTGLSFAEINELRVKDLLDFVQSYSGKKGDAVRKATQGDIDKFYK